MTNFIILHTRIVAFPLQQWLREGAITLRDTQIALLFNMLPNCN